VGNEERRRHPRFDVAGAPGVLDGFRLFEALKLSAGGMLIRTPADLALGQRVRVELPLGDGTFRSEARVVFLGPEFGSARSSSGEERQRVGLAFADTTPADQALLDRFIAEELAGSAAS
jgi:hypothetical protein